MSEKSKSSRFHVYATEEKKEEIKEAAKAENRSVSSYLLWLHEQFKRRKK